MVRTTASGLLLAILILCAACGSSPAEQTRPSSSLAPLTVPSSTPGSESTSTSTPEPTTAATDARTILSAMSVRQGSACDPRSGTGSIVIEHDPQAAEVLRQLTVIVDGRQSVPMLVTGESQTLVDGIACDDRAHTVLVVTVGRDGSSPSRAFAVLMRR